MVLLDRKKSEALSFTRTLEKKLIAKNMPTEEFNKVFYAGIGLFVSRQCSIPMADDVIPRQYYMSVESDTVHTLVSHINETIPLNCKEVMNACWEAWYTRYTYATGKVAIDLMAKMMQKSPSIPGALRDAFDTLEDILEHDNKEG